MVSAHLDSFWLFRHLDPQISQPISRKSVHPLPSMDTFLVYFVKNTKEILSILGKGWTAFSRQNPSVKEVWTSFMLSFVNSCPYNSRFVANFTVICQIYVRKIEICLRKFTTRTFTVTRIGDDILNALPNSVTIYDTVTKIGDNIVNRYQIR